MLEYSQVHVAQADLTTAARYMFWLMFRNVASDGLVFDDPVNAGIISSPGCVLASPSWENTATHVTQDYVYHWTRDAAIVARKLSAAYASGVLPDNQALNDYVRFSQACQQSQGDFAELYYRLAAQILSSRTVPADSLAAPSSPRSGSPRRRPLRRTRPPPCARRGTGCSRPTCPGATPRSCPRSARSLIG
ncbi:MAG TPA: glycoside hydrolase family 15 protein [Trebonia sp.]|nr:glycoside hydrolase family 15 protein [Trebonia sp.]